MNKSISNIRLKISTDDSTEKREKEKFFNQKHDPHHITKSITPWLMNTLNVSSLKWNIYYLQMMCNWANSNFMLYSWSESQTLMANDVTRTSLRTCLNLISFEMIFFTSTGKIMILNSSWKMEGNKIIKSWQFPFI